MRPAACMAALMPSGSAAFKSALAAIIHSNALVVEERAAHPTALGGIEGPPARASLASASKQSDPGDSAAACQTPRPSRSSAAKSAPERAKSSKHRACPANAASIDTDTFPAVQALRFDPCSSSARAQPACPALHAAIKGVHWGPSPACSGAQRAKRVRSSASEPVQAAIHRSAVWLPRAWGLDATTAVRFLTPCAASRSQLIEPSMQPPECRAVLRALLNGPLLMIRLRACHFSRAGSFFQRSLGAHSNHCPRVALALGRSMLHHVVLHAPLRAFHQFLMTPSISPSPACSSQAVSDLLQKRLLRAVSHSNLRAAKRFMAMGADPCPAMDGHTALRLAASSQKIRLLAVLLDGRQLPAHALEDAIYASHLKMGKPSLKSKASERATSMLLDAAEDVATVAAGALELLLRSGTDFDPRALALHVDFSKPPRPSHSWLSLLAGSRFSRKRDQVWAQSAFAHAWQSHLASGAPLPLDVDGFGPVHRAASANNVEALKLMEGHVNFEAASLHGHSPLEMAAFNRAPSSFYFLLTRSSSTFDSFGRDLPLRALIALKSSMRLGKLDLDLTSESLARCCDPLVVDALGRSFADWAAELGFGRAETIARERAALAANVSAATPRAFSDEARDQALLQEIPRLAISYYLSSYGQLDSTKRLGQQVLALGARLSNPSAALSGGGISALQMAASNGFFDLGLHLVRAGADQGPTANESATPLALSLGMHSTPRGPGHEELTRQLAFPDSAQMFDANGHDALWRAVAHGPTSLLTEMDLLIPISNLDAGGRACLESACVQGRQEAFKKLWAAAQAGASLAPWAVPGEDCSWPEISASNGATHALFDARGELLAVVAHRRVGGAHLLGWAAQGQHEDAVTKLLPFFDPNEVDDRGRDALMSALDSRNPAAAKLVALCDLSRRDGLGMSALDLAKFMGNDEVGALIRERLDARRQAKALRKATAGTASLPRSTRRM
jgi:ankyrin repeat protein